MSFVNMTPEQIRSEYGRIVIRHREEMSRAVNRWIKGKGIKELARILIEMEESDKSLSSWESWIRKHLDEATIGEAVCDHSGGSTAQAPRLVGQGKHQAIERQVINMHTRPAAPDEDYVAQYEAEGYTPDVAKRKAIAYEATENAIDKGKLEISTEGDRTKAKIRNRTDASQEFSRKITDAQRFLRYIDEMKVSQLRTKYVQRHLADLNRRWEEVMETATAYSEEVLSDE